MKSIVFAITGASAMQIGERSIQLLLENNQSVDLILSKGAYEVAKSERNINIPVEQNAQFDFWRNKLNVESGKLNSYRWNDHSAYIASGSHKRIGMVIFPSIPAWYTNPQTIEDVIDFIVVRFFDSLGEDLNYIRRWKGPNK